MTKWMIAAGSVAVLGIGLTAYQVIRRGGDPEPATPAEADVAEVKEPPSIAQLTGGEQPAAGSNPSRREGPRSSAPPPTVPPPSQVHRSQSPAPGKLPELSGRSLLAGPPPVNAADVAGAQKLRREGTRLRGVRGTIRLRSAGAEFLPDDGSAPLVLLENQLLQGVEQLQRQQPAESTRRWTVTGLVTEYRGANYLLLDLATIEKP